MVDRLTAQAARRLWPAYVVTIPLLSVIFREQAIWNTVSAASVDPQHAGPRAVSIALTLVIGPVIAFCVFNSREYAILPVSRREYGLARWILGTVVASMCTGVARTIALYNNPPDDRTIQAVVLTGVLSDFLLCGACFGIAALVAGSPRLRALWSRPWINPLLGAAGILAGFALIVAWSVVSIAAMPQASSVLGLPVPTFWGFVVAGVLTLIGLRGRPSTRFSSMARSANAPRIWRDWVRLPASIGLVGLRLLAARELTWACVTATQLLAAIYLVLALRYHTIFPSDVFLRLSERSIPSDWFPFIVIFGVPLFQNAANGLATSLRHLRTLPLSATQLNALVIARPSAYWMWVIALLGLLSSVSIGRVPRIDAPSVVLCIGIWACAHSAELFLGRMYLPVILLLQTVVLWLLGIALPFPFDTLTHPAALGLALVSIAAAANVWLLPRSISYRRPDTAFLLARREL